MLINKFIYFNLIHFHFTNYKAQENIQALNYTLQNKKKKSSGEGLERNIRTMRASPPKGQYMYIKRKQRLKKAVKMQCQLPLMGYYDAQK